VFSVVFIGLGVASALIAFLITHQFENISNSSILKLVVDSEIRNLPVAGVNITYKSYPVDGTSRSVNSIKMRVDNQDALYTLTVSYFVSLGYHQENRFDLSRNGDEITIEQSDSYFEVTKFSWD
jgi:predicted small secreted protein